MDIPSTFRARRPEQGPFRLRLTPIYERNPSHIVDGTDTPARLPRPTNVRPRYVPGRPEDLILRISGSVDQLDVHVVMMMGPNELEDFSSDFWRLSQERRDCVDNDHRTRLANRIIAFRSLGPEGFILDRIMRRPERFAGYNPDDSLDTEIINTLSRHEILDFMNNLFSLGEFERVSRQDVEMLQQRLHDLHQYNNPRRTGPQLRWRQPRHRPETYIVQGLAPSQTLA